MFYSAVILLAQHLIFIGNKCDDINEPLKPPWLSLQMRRRDWKEFQLLSARCQKGLIQLCLLAVATPCLWALAGSDYASERFPPHDPPPRHLPLTQLLMSTVRLRRVTFLKEKKMKISSWVWIRFPCFQGRLFFHSRNVVRGAYGSICAGFVEGFPSQSFVPHEAPTSGNFLMNCGKATALHSTLVSLYFGRSAWHL